jgi:hypothetical protein
MKKAIPPSILIAIMLLAVAVIAEAQQTKKVPRIGWLTGATLSSNALRTEAFARACATLATSRGKTLSLSIDRQKAKSIASPRSRSS